ncbi:MAG: T9SS type A sorting domain-containing protein [Lentimicrobiaceae bacterium]|nr:T9SS type A sorting domain-containing protein [Lentimicrobiaceae bacterium]
MKKIITFLFSVLLITNFVTLSANDYIYSENEQKTNTLCNFRFALVDPHGIGWYPEVGIGITVDGVDYGFLNLPWGTTYAEEIVALPSGEVLFSWIGWFTSLNYFEIYNSLDELIYTSPEDMYEGVFLTYQNECVECIPLTDFDGVYIPEEDQVNLSWKSPESINLIGFDIYRNDELREHVPSTTIFYSDNTAGLENGNYKYCVIPVYPSICDLDETCFEIFIDVGIADYKDNILIYPNPANSIINIAGTDIANIEILNGIGQIILAQYNTNMINVSELTNGIYILSIKTLTGSIIQKKIIINH